MKSLLDDRETVLKAEEVQYALGRQMDLRGLRCPLPVLKIRKALLALAPGEELFARTDDPLAAVDVPNLVRETGDTLVETRREAAALVFRIRRNGDSEN